MKIKKYGLELKEVEREDLELIRQYRNTDIIKNKMIHRQQITREQQLEWFKEIRTVNHYYFLIYKNDSAIGLINGKNIDFVNKTSEGGIFIWNEDRNYEISITASIILNDWNFFINAFEKNYAQYRKKIELLKFDDFNISEPLTENDIFFNADEEPYARSIVELIPTSQQAIYNRILKRSFP